MLSGPQPEAEGLTCPEFMSSELPDISVKFLKPFSVTSQDINHVLPGIKVTGKWEWKEDCEKAMKDMSKRIPSNKIKFCGKEHNSLPVAMDVTGKNEAMLEQYTVGIVNILLNCLTSTVDGKKLMSAQQVYLEKNLYRVDITIQMSSSDSADDLDVLPIEMKFLRSLHEAFETPSGSVELSEWLFSEKYSKLINLEETYNSSKSPSNAAVRQICTYVSHMGLHCGILSDYSVFYGFMRKRDREFKVTDPVFYRGGEVGESPFLLIATCLWMNMFPVIKGAAIPTTNVPAPEGKRVLQVMRGSVDASLYEEGGKLFCSKEASGDPMKAMSLSTEIKVYNFLEKLQGEYIPKVVSTTGFDESKESIEVVTEYIGENLFDVVSKEDEERKEKILPIFAEKAAAALQKVHDFGVLWGDVRLENLLLSKESGDVFICDFGASSLDASPDAMKEEQRLLNQLFDSQIKQ